MSNPTLTRETLAKALSRKPVEGHTEGPWWAPEKHPEMERIVASNEGEICEFWTHPLVEWAEEANARLIATVPDLQDENQVLQAEVRRLQRALENAKDQHYPGCECEACKIINAALTLLSTEGESNG